MLRTGIKIVQIKCMRKESETTLFTLSDCGCYSRGLTFASFGRSVPIPCSAAANGETDAGRYPCNGWVEGLDASIHNNKQQTIAGPL